jgi:hypothetical protein
VVRQHQPRPGARLGQAAEAIQVHRELRHQPALRRRPLRARLEPLRPGQGHGHVDPLCLKFSNKNRPENFSAFDFCLANDGNFAESWSICLRAPSAAAAAADAANTHPHVRTMPLFTFAYSDNHISIRHLLKSPSPSLSLSPFAIFFSSCRIANSFNEFCVVGFNCTHTHTHTVVHIYIVCVCVSVVRVK